MGSGFAKMKKQAKLFEEQMSKMQEELQKKIFEGESAGGLIKVTLNGEKELKKIKIDPETLTDAEGLEDLILNALETVYKKIDKESDGINLPF
ncbi:MAG: YbaB/EbfC family nucleoid-associated protein [Simkaniaceae bacterium]